MLLERRKSNIPSFPLSSQANSKQLGIALASQTEATKSGLDMLSQAYASLEQLQSHFQAINALCGECQSLIDAHERIQHLSTVNNNLGRTLQDAEAIAALPAEAAEAQRLLKHGNGGLMQAYECLAILEGTSYKARQALEAIALPGGSQSEGLSVYFNQVGAAMAQLEERMWNVIRNYNTVAVNEPWVLVSVVQIIEMQEIVDSQLIIAGLGEGRSCPAFLKVRRLLDSIWH